MQVARGGIERERLHERDHAGVEGDEVDDGAEDVGDGDIRATPTRRERNARDLLGLDAGRDRVLPSSVAETPKRDAALRIPSPSSSPPSVSTARPATRKTRARLRRSTGSAASSERPERARPASASANQSRSRPPSRRLRVPSRARRSSGTGAAAVQTKAARGRRARSGAISAPRPATPAARKVVPPRKVPAAAPGRSLALAAMPAARFSSSNPDRTTVTTKAGRPKRAARASSPRKKASAPKTTSATPATSSASAESEDTDGILRSGRPPLSGRSARKE